MKREMRWMLWRFRADNLTLVCNAGGYPYEIDLETCTTSAQVLDWIMQVAGKTWATDTVLAGLVRAFDDLLYPQANLCSSGISKTIEDVRDVIEQEIDEPYSRLRARALARVVAER
jgi:hypothetical protein